MPTIKVILNPVSGRGAGQRTAEVVRHSLTEAKATFEIVETTEQRSAVAQAAQAVREGWDIIAAVGGDGAANEVLKDANALSREEAKCDVSFSSSQPINSAILDIPSSPLLYKSRKTFS